MCGRHMEKAENQQEDEEIVDAQREFDDVSGNKLQSQCAPVPEENHHREDGSQGDPNRAPDQGLAELHDVGAAMEHAQVQHQHSENEEIE